MWLLAMPQLLHQHLQEHAQRMLLGGLLLQAVLLPPQTALLLPKAVLLPLLQARLAQRREQEGHELGCRQQLWM